MLSCIFLSCSSTKKQAVTGTNNPGVSGFNQELSQKFGLQVPAQANVRLAEEVLNWRGTPYKLGGTGKTGVDCSGFICQVFPVVYQIQPPRTTADMHKFAKPVMLHEIQEGDIVFFTIGSAKPSHSGIYLWNGYFAHASTSKGVMLSNLSEAYWKKYFTGAGRFLPAKP
jgi:murein DD-endopeptidase / murein LD-carboxypeptidase